MQAQKRDGVDEDDDYAGSGRPRERDQRESGGEGDRERDRGQNTILGLDPVYVCMYTHMYQRWKIAELNASGTLGTPLELHPFSRETSASSDKLCTRAYIATQ